MIFDSRRSGKRSKTVKNGRKTVEQRLSAVCRRIAKGVKVVPKG
jgi:ASC-1-like (ASCH) protein